MAGVTWDGEKFVFDEPADIAKGRHYWIRLGTGQAVRQTRIQQYAQEGVLTETTWTPAQFVWDAVNERLRYTPAKPYKPTVRFQFTGVGDVPFDGNGDFPPPAPEPAPRGGDDGAVACTREDILASEQYVAGYSAGYAEGVKTAAEQARHSIEMLERRLLENRGK